MRSHRRRGFTLLQLLVVLAVLLLLLGLLLPAVQKVREAAARAQSVNNLKQIALAMHNAATVYDGALPPSVGKFAGQDGTYFFHILPYIEQDNVYRTKAVNTVIKTYLAPADPTQAGNQPLTSYASNSAVFGVNPQKLARLPGSFPKGTSNTIVFMERYAIAGNKAHAWADTGELATYLDGTKGIIEFNVPPQKASNTAAQAFASAGCNVGIGDGSVRVLSPAIKLGTFRWACDPKSEAPAPADW